MIDFKNIKKIKRRIKKHTVEEGDFYLLDKTTAEFKEIHKSVGTDDIEAFVKAIMDACLCDDKGKLLHLIDDDYQNIGKGLLQDIFMAVQTLTTGEKKS